VAGGVSDRLGVAIVGCGRIAGSYAEDIARRAHLRLVGATDADPARADAFATQHGVRAFRMLDEVLADGEVELVANLTSHDAHVEVSTAALEAGRHVFSEKPMALSASEARLLAELARARGCRLGSAPIVGMGELAQTARRWIDEGRLGSVRLAFADVNWGRIETWHPAPAGFYAVGPLWDVGIYPITLLTTLFGPVARVTATAHRLLEARHTTDGEPFGLGAPDCVIATLEMAAGVVVRLTVDFYVADPARQRGVELHGDAGSLWLSNWFQFGGALEHAPWGEAYRPVGLLREPEVAMPWAAGLEDLAASVVEDRPPAMDPESAVHVVEVIEAVLQSAVEERPVAVTSAPARPEPAAWAEALPLGG
jgi:predicted dehydrogenase